MTLVRPLGTELVAAVAVGDGLGAHVEGGVLGRRQISEIAGVGFHEEDVAVRAHGRDHVEVESDLLAPARVCLRGGRSAALVDLGEAGVRRCARQRRETEPGSVGGQIARRIGIVVGVDDGDRDAGAAGGERIRALEVGRRVPVGVGRRRCRGHAVLVGHDLRVAMGLVGVPGVGAHLVALADEVGVAVGDAAGIRGRGAGHGGRHEQGGEGQDDELTGAKHRRFPSGDRACAVCMGLVGRPRPKSQIARKG